MKAAGGPQKLRFTVVSFSGEDNDYPVRELLFHSPQTRGWQTPRFCKYPQEILLKMEHACKIQQIQILSHEYKIATKVEVYVAAPGPGEDVSRTPFKRLGYLSFDSNERSNHQARELKSVHVNVPAYYLRLVVHRCHVNKLNVYNQVGLVALNLIGEPVKGPQEMPPGGYLQLHPPVQNTMAYYNQAAADVADINLDIHVDTVTANKIRDLARAKDQAVANEDYDEAKKLKASIDRLKVLGQKVAQLEARKRAAVEKEDYDTAKLIKADIDKLRAAGDVAAISSEQYLSRGKKASVDGGAHPTQRGSSTGGGAARQSGSGGGAQAGPEDAEEIQGDAVPAYDADQGMGAAGDGLTGEASFDAGAAGGAYVSYDERPAQGRGRYTPSGEAMADANAMGSGRPPPAATIKSDIPAPPGWPADLPAPEPLAGATAKDAEALGDLAGEYCARAAYSKNWQLREGALTYLAAQAGELASKPGSFRTLINVLKRGMKDKVANVFLTSLTAFQSIVDIFVATGGREVHGACESVIPLLVEKLGDANARLREAAKDALVALAGLKESGLKSATAAFLKPVKNQNAWRLILGLLQLLQELVPSLGISKSGDGFDLGELMEFVGKAYSNSNADVRAAAVRVTREVYDLVGVAMKKYLPKDISPKIKEQIETLLEADGGLAAAPPPVAAPPPQQRSAPKAAPAAKAGRGGPQAKAAPARGTPQAEPPPEQAAAPDDPRPFEAELRKRESALGPHHPDVAESCGNLAILYNQKGQTDKALPLYQRALAIYEKHYGPDHPEVAHTLTDLAVLHLEQGRDGVGRPLLERALIIQEKALGPDHPDVMAIKDVLNSE